jgi:hypothetical protein
MVMYFDVFHHPLTEAELTRLVAPGRPEAILAACDHLVGRGLVAREGRWRFRPGMSADIARRRMRARHAEVMWPWAVRAAEVLDRLPWVSGLMVTGSLSKKSTGPGGDVDFLVLVQPGRVWTLKTALQAMRRVLPPPARELFCTNYLLATDRLQIEDRNLYTAVELATAVPLAGRDACVALLEANGWARRFVPGLDWSLERAKNLPHRAVLEPAPAGGAGEGLERAALHAWDRYWDRKYGWLDEGVRRQRFKRSDGVATNHLHDFRDYVLREVGARLDAAGLHESLDYDEVDDESCGLP